MIADQNLGDLDGVQGSAFTQVVGYWQSPAGDVLMLSRCRDVHLDNDSPPRYYSFMSKVADDILNDAMRLSTTERAALAAELLASLDGEPEEEVEAAWAAEIQRRVERVRSGKAKGKPWPEVRARLQRRGE